MPSTHYNGDGLGKTNSPRTEGQGEGGEGREGETETLNSLNREQLLHISRSLGLHSTWWFDESFLAGISPPSGLLQRRVQKAKEYIESDDKLIDRDGGVGGLDIEEVKMAMVDRGLDVLGKQDGELRRRLKDWVWLRGKKGWGVETMLLTRYDS